MAVFSVVGGLSYKDVADSIGIDISKNTWTQWVKDVGMVCAEALGILGKGLSTPNGMKQLLVRGSTGKVEE